MIRVAEIGRNPTMRYFARTHRVSVAWLHETFSQQNIGFVCLRECVFTSGLSPWQRPSTQGSATYDGRVPCPGQSILPTVYPPGAHWPTGCFTCSCSGP